MAILKVATAATIIYYYGNKTVKSNRFIAISTYISSVVLSIIVNKAKPDMAQTGKLAQTNWVMSIQNKYCRGTQTICQI